MVALILGGAEDNCYGFFRQRCYKETGWWSVGVKIPRCVLRNNRKGPLLLDVVTNDPEEPTIKIGGES